MRNFVSFTILGAVLAQKGHRTTEPVYTCPAPYELVGKVCQRQISAPGTLYCQTGLLRDGACFSPINKESSCPAGSMPTANGCAYTETIPAEKFCPVNTHDIGGECQTYSVTGIVETCARGILVNGQCEIVEKLPLIIDTHCPIGYEMAKGGCWKHAQMDCTPPHVGKRMLQAKPLAHAGGKAPHAAPAAVLPLPKYVPQPAKLAVLTKQCEVKLDAPIVEDISCPNGMMMEGRTCVTKTYEPSSIECSLPETHLCFPAKTQPASLRCAAGFHLEGELCVKTTNVPKNVACPAGAAEMNGVCMHAVASPVVKCAPGQTPSGELCLGVDTVPPTVQVTVTCQGKNCYRH